MLARAARRRPARDALVARRSWRGARARSCSCSTCCWSRSALAWLTELAGLSLALGAFLAGMLIAETEYKHQVETDIRPFHDVLLGLFFITVGMKLDSRRGASHAGRWCCAASPSCRCCSSSRWSTVLARVFGAAHRRRAAHRPLPRAGGRVRLRAAGAGAASAGCCRPIAAQAGAGGMVLSMLATPLIITHSNRIVMRLSASDWLHAVGGDDDDRAAQRSTPSGT